MSSLRLQSIIVCILIFGVTCGQNHMDKSPEGRESVQYRAGVSLVPLKEIKRIPLRVDSGLPPIEMNGFQVYEYKFYVYDHYKMQQAYIFNENGSLFKKVGGAGQGPGEYQWPSGFCRLTNHLHLISKSQYIIYDSGGDFLSRNLDIHKIGWGSGIYPGWNNTAYFTVYSRYRRNATIYHVSAEGKLLNQFSPPPDDFLVYWDQLTPGGVLVLRDQKIYQILNNKYEIKIFNPEGVFLEKIKLASFIYVEPDIGKAKNVKTRKDLKKFQYKSTLVTGFFSLKDGFVTVLANTRLGKSIEYLEFWDQNFWGLGRFKISQNEKLVGTHQNHLDLTP